MIVTEEMARILSEATPISKKVGFVQADLKTLRDKGFELLEGKELEAKDKATVLRLINGILDSEMATMRYLQSEKRIRNTFYAGIFGAAGIAVGAIINFLTSHGII